MKHPTSGFNFSTRRVTVENDEGEEEQADCSPLSSHGPHNESSGIWTDALQDTVESQTYKRQKNIIWGTGWNFWHNDSSAESLESDFEWARLFTKLFVQLLRINCWICFQLMIKMVIKKFLSKLFPISCFLTSDAEQSILYFVLCVFLSPFLSHFLPNHPQGIVLQSGHTTLSSSCGALFLGICPDFSSVHCSAVRWSSQDRRLNPPPRYKSPNTIYRLS